MQKTIVIPRLGKDGTPILFLPQDAANYGRIVCYSHIGQHSEADVAYYTNDTKPDKINACADLIREYENLGEKTESIIRKRLNWDMLSWRR